MPEMILEAQVHDWSIDDGADADLRPEQRQEYRFTFERCGPGQFTIEFVPVGADPEARADGAQILIEVNEGVPCLHVATELGSDNLAAIFFTAEGVVIAPETSTQVEHGAYDPRSPRYPAIRISDKS